MKPAIMAATLCAAGAFASSHGPRSELADLELDGVITPYSVIRVGGASDGIVADVLVERGDQVTAGQVLARLDFRVEQASADLAKARTELQAVRERAKARVENAWKTFSRYSNLLEDGIIADEDYEVAHNNLCLEELQLLEAEENMRISELEYERATAVLDRGTIRAPVDGVVVERHLWPGELLSKSAEPTVVTLAQLHPLIVKVNVPVEVYEQLEVGSSALVTIELGEPFMYAAKVKAIDHLVDTASDSFQVRLELPNESLRLPAGLACRVRFVE